MPDPTCPRCGGRSCSRMKRAGFLQRFVYSQFGRFPWECGDCRKLFLYKKRGKLKKRRPSRDSEERPGNSSGSMPAS